MSSVAVASARAATSPVRRLGLVDIGIVLAINVMWGLNLVSMKMVISATAPFSAGALRAALLLIFCLPFLRIVPKRMPMVLLFAAIAGAVHLTVINLALRVATNVGAASIVTLLGVPFALMLGVVFLGEKLSARRLLGVAVSLAGCVMLMLDPRVVHEGPALLLILLATVIWSFGALVQKRLAGVSIFNLYAWVGLMGCLVLLPASYVLEKGAFALAPRLGLHGALWLLFAVLGPTLLGQGGLTWLLQRHPMSTIMPLTLLAPAVTVLASSLVFGSPVTLPMIVGGLITLVGALIISYAIVRTPPELLLEPELGAP